MKLKTLLILTIMGFFLNSCSSKKISYLGKSYLNAFRLSKELYKDSSDIIKFNNWEKEASKQYTKYRAKKSKLNEINIKDASIKIICAAWCSDTRKQVSSFMKVLEAIQFPEDQVSFHFVNKEKKAPGNSFIKDYDFTKVPTFVIYRNNIEIGSIIETPAETLEKDLVWILGKKQ